MTARWTAAVWESCSLVVSELGSSGTSEDSFTVRSVAAAGSSRSDPPSPASGCSNFEYEPGFFTRPDRSDLTVLEVSDVDWTNFGYVASRAFPVGPHARCLAGAAVTRGQFVTSDATSRAVPVTLAAAGATYIQVLGEALESAAGAGEFFACKILLCPAIIA